MKRIVTAAVVVAVLVIAGVVLFGGGHPEPQTAVQRCTAAYQAYVNAGLAGQPAARIRAYGSGQDVRILDAAQAACDKLTPAQAKQAGAAVMP